MITRWLRKCVIRSSSISSIVSASSSTNTSAIQLSIVGSGPAGFYCAQGLLRALPNCAIDIYEKLPVPFGLIRYGVAPDHQDVKNVVNVFTKVAHDKRVAFYGNVSVGQHITIGDLIQNYHAVVLCTGAEDCKHLSIPGESLQNVFSAKEVVGWYNGFPDFSKLAINLESETVTIFGLGNVALDIGRILLTPVDILKKTDITEYALQSLSRSRVKRVLLVGRRGPLQVAFTIKEFREFTKLKQCRGIIRNEDIHHIDEQVINSLPRPRQRLTKLMVNHSLEQLPASEREWELMFHHRPVEFLPSSKNDKILEGVRLAVNSRFDQAGSGIPVPYVTNSFETKVVDTGLAIKCIGYKSVPICDTIPFDHEKCVIAHNAGRVIGIPGLYCCGWVASGPVGVILTTVDNSFDVSSTIADDAVSGQLSVSEKKEGSVGILRLLNRKGHHAVTFGEWEVINAEEQRRGNILGKPREKFTDLQEMLNVANGAK